MISKRGQTVTATLYQRDGASISDKVCAGTHGECGETFELDGGRDYAKRVAESRD